MLSKLIFTGTALLFSLSSYAENINSCQIEVAVATPPVAMDQRVAFNATNYQGIIKSITLKGGSAPYLITELPCSDVPYTISATLYTSGSNQLFNNTPIGECTLKAGPVVLGSENSTISVVFPHDFNC
ncbi:hypothetical protein ACNVED_10395 [Legionella sp. D16C41]|uniref:hypothetical protein n=1 Tax=Legionella sp. D16C41 TaxID=3402688 RepID=UPI003AF79134